MGATGARPRPQPRATALPARAAGAASCCLRRVGTPVVRAAGLRIAARLGLNAVGRLLACAGAAHLRRAHAAWLIGSWSSPRRSSRPGYPYVRDTLRPEQAADSVHREWAKRDWKKNV